MLKNLFALAEREGIAIEWWDFKPPLEAVYWATPGLPPVIGLANSLAAVPRAYFRSVLAEELGHFYTTAANALPVTFFHYRDRLAVSRAEYRARKWAALYLVPERKLYRALRKGIREVWELAEWFGVTEEIMALRLNLLDGKHLQRKIC
jgi:Zn-dependent peptidase ImmA (M78 family)